MKAVIPYKQMTIQEKHLLVAQALDDIAGLTTPRVKATESPDEVQHSLWYLYKYENFSRAECGLTDKIIKEWEMGNNQENQDDSQNEDDEREPLRPMILDVLGEYDSGSREVTLYTELIWKVARKRGIPYHVLYQLVLAHETAHAVTHLGKDADGKIWKDFKDASKKKKEFFAQIYPHLLFQAAENGDDLRGYSQVLTGEDLLWKKPLYDIHLFHEAMKTLGETQLDQYNTWQEDESKSVAEINRMLHRDRLR